MVAVNPRLPKSFWSTPNCSRTEAQIRRWWCRPFVINHDDVWIVYCLDGGAWDRPTQHGTFKKEAEAISLANQIHNIYWSQLSSNELPLPFPYEMQIIPSENFTGNLSARPVGPAALVRGLKDKAVTAH